MKPEFFTSPVSPRAPDPVRILPDPGWFSVFRIIMVRLTPSMKVLNHLKYSFNRLLKIYLLLRYRDPDSVSGSSSLVSRVLVGPTSICQGIQEQPSMYPEKGPPYRTVYSPTFICTISQSRRYLSVITITLKSRDLDLDLYSP